MTSKQEQVTTDDVRRAFIRQGGNVLKFEEWITKRDAGVAIREVQQTLKHLIEMARTVGGYVTEESLDALLRISMQQDQEGDDA